MEHDVYRLKVTLRGARPPIWRRLEVPSGVTLDRFHEILQVVMGWTDSHLHQFQCGGASYGRLHPEIEVEQQDERRVRLRDVLRRPKARLVYEYDFGDGWLHDVVLETIAPAGPENRQARVVAGKRACPPEDVGGVDGYYRFLEAIADPEHPEHQDMLEWVGEFDPDAFDVEAMNLRLGYKAGRARKVRRPAVR
jgi:hypothetical protein